MKRLNIDPLANSNKQSLSPQTSGLALSEVRYVSPSVLQSNSHNNFFPEETARYFEELEEDVRERGVIVPLIAKRNGQLLAGHNRLRVALNLGLPRVPVQYVETQLTEQEEIRFIISDNLFRRQLSNSDKIRLYKHLYPNFDERLELRHTVTPATRVEQFDPSKSPLTATVIARDTGQSAAAVQKQLQKYEAQSRRESMNNRLTQQEVAVMSASKSEEQMRAREREADRALKSAVEEIAMQLQRTDVSDDWRRTAMQRVLRTMEKQQKLLPA